MQPRRIALLALLATDPHHTLSREKLIAYLWPESDADQGRHRLSESLYVLRKGLGEGALFSEGDSIRLDPSRFFCDAISFSEALRKGDLEEAVSFYVGPFMDGFFLKGAPEFNRWAESVRSTLAEDQGRALESLATAADRNGDPIKAVEWWGRLASHDPYNSRYALGRMEALARVGDPGNALHYAKEHTRFLMEELGTEPTPQLLSFVEALRNGDVPIPVGGGEGDAVAPPHRAQAFNKNPAFPADGEPLPAMVSMVPPEKRRMVRVAAVGALITLLGAWAVYTSLVRDPGSDLIADLVVVPPFENRTGDPEFDEVSILVAEWVEEAIRQVEGVQLVPASFARQYAAEAERDDVANPARAVAERSRAGWLIGGSIRDVGGSLELRAEIIDLSQQWRARDVEEVGARAPLHHLLDRFARRVAGALAYEFDPWMGEIEKGPLPSPPTIEAFREHRLGYEAYSIPDGAASFKHHMAAYALDSTLVRALVAAAFMTDDLSLKDSLAQIASRRREGLSRLGQLDLDILLAVLANDLEEALSGIKEVARLEGNGFNSVLVSVFAIRLNRPAEALAATERYDPTLEWRRGEAHAYWFYRTEALHMLGEFERELAEAQRGRETYPNRPGLLRSEVRSLAALGRLGEVSSLLHQARSLSNTNYTAALVAGAELREHGFLDESRSTFNRAAEWLAAAGGAEGLSSEERLDLAEALYGAEKWGEARDVAESLRAESPDDLSTLGMVGRTAARLGNPALAAEVMDQLSTMSRREAPGEHLYTMASIQAVLGQEDEAMTTLFRAFSEGLRHGLRLHQDMDFESMREREDFRALVAPKG